MISLRKHTRYDITLNRLSKIVGDSKITNDNNELVNNDSKCDGRVNGMHIAGIKRLTKYIQQNDLPSIYLPMDWVTQRFNCSKPFPKMGLGFSSCICLLKDYVKPIETNVDKRINVNDKSVLIQQRQLCLAIKCLIDSSKILHIHIDLHSSYSACCELQVQLEH